MQHVDSGKELTRLILDDLLAELGGPRQRIRSLLRTLAWLPARHFAGLAAAFDETVAQAGFRESVRQVIPRFVSHVQRSGCEHIPETGPLLIASNHPGSCDSLLIAASLPRDDLKIIAAEFSTLRRLPNASKRLIFVESKQSSRNFGAVRAAIRHLRSGGALLIFPGGCIEPDPSILPEGAARALHGWSKSIELLVRKVPQTRVQISIVGGVIMPAFVHNPLITRWQGPRDGLAVVGVLQTIVQLLLPGWLELRPTVSFSRPKMSEELVQATQSPYQSLIAEAGRLLKDHSNGRGATVTGSWRPIPGYSDG